MKVIMVLVMIQLNLKKEIKSLIAKFIDKVKLNPDIILNIIFIGATGYCMKDAKERFNLDVNVYISNIKDISIFGNPQNPFIFI